MPPRPSKVKEEVGEKADTLEKTVLSILISSNLREVTAAGLRTRLETETGKSFSSPEDRLLLRQLISRSFREHSSKFSSYTAKKKKASSAASPQAPAKAKVAAKKKSVASPKKSAEGTKKPRKPQHCVVSPELQAIVKVQEGERQEISKLLWEYIRSQGLQKAEKKSLIVCDDLMKAVCDGEDCINTLHVIKHLNRNLTRTEGEVAKDRPAKKSRAPQMVSVSAELQKIVAVEKGDREEIRSLMWDYIRTNGLQDEKNKKEIICDALLSSLCEGKKRVGILEVTRILNRHLTNEGTTKTSKAPKASKAKKEEPSDTEGSDNEPEEEEMAIDSETEESENDDDGVDDSWGATTGKGSLSKTKPKTQPKPKAPLKKAPTKAKAKPKRKREESDDDSEDDFVQRK